MARDRGLVREVQWLDVMPWLCLFRVVWMAADPRKLLLAAVGLMAMIGGWRGATWLYSNSEDAVIVEQREHYQDWYRSWPWEWNSPGELATRTPKENTEQVATQPNVADSVQDRCSVAADAALDVPVRMSRPFLHLFSADASMQSISLSLLCGLWVLVVWAFCGGAITRIAAVRLAQEQRCGLVQSARHALSKYRSYLAAPLFPFAGVVLFVAAAAVAGLIADSGFGFGFIAYLWPLGLLISLFVAVLVVGLLLGWPLMWATISTEATDAFDGLNRSFAYVYQRPFHYAFYIALSAALAVAGWAAFSYFAQLTLYLGAWGVSWGSGAERAAEVYSRGGDAHGAAVLAFWATCLQLIVVAYGYSFFWTAASGVYALLRRDTDATAMDEVYLYEAESTRPLPLLTPDESGVPHLADEGPPLSPSERKSGPSHPGQPSTSPGEPPPGGEEQQQP